MAKEKKAAMSPKEMKRIRKLAGFETPKALGDDLDRSERWVQYRESGETPIDRLEARALRNVRDEAAAKAVQKLR